MLPVFPVYILSTCVTKSFHAGALPSPAYPYFDNHCSREVHTVSWLPGPWVVRTASVFGDFQAMILEGHDTGMMIPHISPIMDNILLPMTLLSSSCTFLFSSSSKKCHGKGVAGFFPAYAPFLYCDAEVSQKPEKPGQPKPQQPLSSDEVQRTAAKKNKVRKFPGEELGPKVKAIDQKLRGAEQKVQDRLNDLGDRTKYQLNIKGRGKICIPTKMTILMQLSFADFFYGWGKFLFSRSLDALIGAGLSWLPPSKKALAGRYDQSAANRLAQQGLERADATSELFRRINRLEDRKIQWELYKELAPEIALKTVVDNVKLLVTDGKLKAPYGLFSYGLADGKGTLLWWGKLEGTPLPFNFKGLRGPAMEALKDTCYQPAVDELTADTPNYARAPKQPPSQFEEEGAN